jgi:hypothetical protein
MLRLSNRYTTSFGCRDLVERDTRPLGHLSCKQSKNQQEQVEQVLKLRDVIEGLKPNLNYGGVLKTSERVAGSARASTRK